MTNTTSAEPRRGGHWRNEETEGSASMGSDERPGESSSASRAALHGQRGGDDRLVRVDAAMGEMPMPGGWTMSMMWMRMCGQTWFRAWASFVGMWIVMMVAMMLPSFVPMLWRFRQAVGGTGEARLNRLTATGGHRVLRRVDRRWNRRVSAGRRAGSAEMQWPALARAVPMRGGFRRPDRRRAPVHGVEGASSRLLQAVTGARPCAAGATPSQRGDTAFASAFTAAIAARG